MGKNEDVLKSRSRKNVWDEGAVTLEAAIALPVFICVIVAFSFLLRCVHVQERMQHAITQAAIEIAGTGYIYGLSGVQSLQQDAEGAAKAKVGQAKDAVMKAADFEQWVPQAASTVIDEQLDLMTSEALGAVNSLVFSQYIKLIVSKYLTASAGDVQVNTERFLQSMNVIGGSGGLDFLGSTFLADGSDQVVIRVKYTLKAPIFIKELSLFQIKQEAYAKVWLYKEKNKEAEKKEEKKDDIWSLSNFERGRKIREIFHANLPLQFPGLSTFEGGTATLIKSLDTTANSYQDPQKLKATVVSYIRNLSEYGGQETPWGKDGIVIREADIRVRRLVLVIPENEISAEANAVLNNCIQQARSEGVVLVVERYAKKDIGETEKTGDDGE